jgi:hypothetical protein
MLQLEGEEILRHLHVIIYADLAEIILGYVDTIFDHPVVDLIFGTLFIWDASTPDQLFKYSTEPRLSLKRVFKRCLTVESGTTIMHVFPSHVVYLNGRKYSIQMFFRNEDGLVKQILDLEPAISSSDRYVPSTEKLFRGEFLYPSYDKVMVDLYGNVMTWQSQTRSLTRYISIQNESRWIPWLQTLWKRKSFREEESITFFSWPIM